MIPSDWLNMGDEELRARLAEGVVVELDAQADDWLELTYQAFRLRVIKMFPEKGMELPEFKHLQYQEPPMVVKASYTRLYWHSVGDIGKYL